MVEKPVKKESCFKSSKTWGFIYKRRAYDDPKCEPTTASEMFL